MSISRKNLFFIMMLVTIVLALVGLTPRIRAERANKTVAFIVEYKDIVSLSYQSGEEPIEIKSVLQPHGVEGMTVQEYTGEELTYLNPMQLKFGAAGTLGVGGGDIPADVAVVIIDSASPYASLIYEYLSFKLPAVRKAEMNGETILVLPGTADYFRQYAFIPDFQGLEAGNNDNINILFRPGPCLVSDGERVAASLEWLAQRYPQIKSVIPAGAIMAGYPDLTPVAKVLKEHNISFVQVEFVTQIGVSDMARLMAPNILPLHSITREEIISRRMPRTQIRERFVRAVHERSVRLLIMRPYDLQMGRGLDSFIAELDATRGDIEGRGYNFGWPDTLPNRSATLAGAFACTLSFLFCAWMYAVRTQGTEDGRAAFREVSCLILLSLIGAGLMWKVSFIARLAGGFGSALVAAEAALAALEYRKKTAAGLALGLLVVLAGGLSIAAFYGTTLAALRLTPFSGVKLTLLLPPLLILLHDFRRKIHPESISEIVVRPAIWGELVLIGVMMLALLVMALRSDNVSSVPAWEAAFRDFMERTLLIRPRTKEFVIGYPALILYYYMIKKSAAVHYREALRIAASLAFSSAVNTFCHFHTELTLSIARIINGWWVGILVGLLAVAVVNFIGVPLWKRGLREVFR